MRLLPDDPAELEGLLAGAVRGFDSAIHAAREGAERQRAERRRAVLLAFADTLSRQAATLRDLGDLPAADAAQALAEEVARDLAAVTTLLAGASVPVAPAPEATAPADAIGLDASEAEAEAEEVAPAPPVPSAPPAPIAAPDRDGLIVATAIRAEAHELDLMAWSGETSVDEIEARVALLALRGRTCQAEHAAAADDATPEGRLLYEAFSTMTRVAREVLTPAGRFVPYLQRQCQMDWRAETARWRSRLDAIRQKSSMDAARHEAERRRLAHAAELARVKQLVLAELRAVATDGSREPGWEFDFLDALREALTCADPRDAELLDLAAPHADLLATGGEFRALRRQLKRRDGTPSAIGAEDAASGTPAAPAIPAVHPFEKYRGTFGEHRAALVGASSREYRRVALRDFFGFAELEWFENERTEGADGAAIARRIENGAFHVVFLLADFSSHAMQDHVKDACKRSGVPFVLVRRGYGIVAFGRALDEAGRLVAPAR